MEKDNPVNGLPTEAEKLASAYADTKGGPCSENNLDFWNATFNDFLAGYSAALQSKQEAIDRLTGERNEIIKDAVHLTNRIKEHWAPLVDRLTGEVEDWKATANAHYQAHLKDGKTFDKALQEIERLKKELQEAKQEKK